MRIVVTAPSRQMILADGSVDFAHRAACAKTLRALGAELVFTGNTLLSSARFAGEDALRAEALMLALEVDRTDLVLALRGGYGATRLLPLLDWRRIERSAVPMMGFSDFTAIQTALYVKTRRASWHGPTFSSFADPAPSTIEGFLAALAPAWPGVEFAAEGAPELALEGLLWGGNLSMLASLLGTPWFDAEAFAGGILFIEEVNESAYRIERMLLQLLDAGVLGAQRAILLGDLTGADRPASYPGDFRLETALAYVEGRLGASVPIVRGFPMGHGRVRRAIPFGRIARLEATQGCGRLTLACEE